jgi:hypothetical protein
MLDRFRVAGAGLLALAAAGLLAACGSSQATSSSSTISTISTGSTRSAAPTNPATTGTGAAPAATSATAPSRCAGSQLKLAYVGTEGATGHLEVTLALRNVSPRSCTLRGYPGARLLDAAGRTLPLHFRRGGGFFPDSQEHPRLVMLQPGVRARYGLSFATNNEYTGARHCSAAAVLMARAPGATEWARVRVGHGVGPRIAPCGAQLVLSPVYAS